MSLQSLPAPLLKRVVKIHCDVEKRHNFKANFKNKTVYKKKKKKKIIEWNYNSFSYIYQKKMVNKQLQIHIQLFIVHVKTWPCLFGLSYKNYFQGREENLISIDRVRWHHPVHVSLMLYNLISMSEMLWLWYKYFESGENKYIKAWTLF